MTKEELLQFQSLEDILANAALTPIFQPIVSLKEHQIYGYEALIRGPSNSLLHSPINLFDAASRHGRLAELDLLCRELAIAKFGELGLTSKLFINTIPAALLQPDYPHGLTLQFLKKAGLSAHHVVIELTEQYPIDDYDVMREATAHYRDMGFSIAIDDLGAGYSGLRTWSEIKPDYVKLDRHFIQNIHEDRQKRQFVQSIIDIAQGINCKIIGEGVEVREEYLAAQTMEIQFAQGYYFARPNAIPKQELDANLFAQRQTPNLLNTGKPRANTLVSSLLTPLTPVRIYHDVNSVGERFQHAVQLAALPVINDDNSIAGMVWRDEFMTLYASRYGRDLHGRKPIHQFMDRSPIIAETALPLKTLSQQITSQDSTQQHSMFIITEHGYYRGIGSLMDLLRQITDMQLTIARYANPLSGLPGNVPLTEHLCDAIAEQRDVTVCYFDLDNFKPYNDTYGFGKGDKVISQTARLLSENLDPEIDFLGHVGGDDFIIAFESHDWRSRCQLIFDAFNTLHTDLYQPQHLQQQGLYATDRNGKPVFYPLLSLSVGAVKLILFNDILNEVDLAEHASKAKSAAKKIAGHSLYELYPANRDLDLPGASTAVNDRLGPQFG
ncbi:diguanylate cyclase/phosphodiesterase (GGDEF & EAL domains) with PAS/PAC sensor(s) [Methylophaga frappieri]|uniref:Diguanylate cyclase/phosphodiesterase (GGDEF & EAL domains) with PAS/PAC sensor(S) n=1 Tax=Methylophaga frappieri (strain ATCC BAA-2434 / DSM 25690 / JAM7) TaxID=754477 RepID=I1YIZ4_METFJ|nr:bifunctional diguanylate cyclase/phosphodiesterase [Methylophaga frappieri]AFJ02887.1 diguanylate cyclase/phosphodiesterase (GGDEF & EAL domains) with PAS/PAC sensor(s) [Methylophaga frappieri]